MTLTEYFLKEPVIGISELHRNRHGNYQCTFKEYRRGSFIEFYERDQCDGKYKWLTGWIGHTKNDYYIIGYNHINLEGLCVRVRKSA